MSELFDSLNLSNSAGPSSSQQSSSQPSTSKVFWHASPSPGVLRQLHNWTPNKSQESPTLPLCTQAFVGELKKLPGALASPSPLVSRSESAKRKLQANSRHVSDPTANRGRAKEYLVLELSDDEDESEPRRLLLGDAGESSPESRRRRTMDAGNTGRVREPSSPSELGSAGSRTTLPPQLPPLEKELSSSHRRLDRRPPRRRKKESFMAGLGFTDDSGRATDCLKLFEDLQAAIQSMQVPRPSTSGSAETGPDPASMGQRATVTFDRGNGSSRSEGGRLTPREGINRTTSAPSSSRAAHSQDAVLRSSQHEMRQDGLQPRRVFRPVKSDHDVFRAAGAAEQNGTRVLQPRLENGPREAPPQPQPLQDVIKEPITHAAPVSLSRHHSQSRAQEHDFQQRQPRPELPQAEAKSFALSTKIYSGPIDPPTLGDAVPRQVTSKTTITTAAVTAAAQPSPVKRSARIEAMQHTHASTKKLGVRGPSLLSRSSPRKPAVSSSSSTGSGGAGRALSRGMSQARQPGLARTCSQFAPSQASQTAGPAAPFRPPAIATVTRANVVRTASPAHTAATARIAAKTRENGQPSSSDDSFGDDDDAFLALACELEY